MIANLLNTLLGLWLVYAAVLDHAWAENTWSLPVAGALIVVLALWARATDYRKWQSTTNIVLGIAVLLLTALHWQGMASPLVMFWAVFWPGILVAVFALWSALYRERSAVVLER